MTHRITAVLTILLITLISASAFARPNKVVTTKTKTTYNRGVKVTKTKTVVKHVPQRRVHKQRHNRRNVRGIRPTRTVKVIRTAPRQPVRLVRTTRVVTPRARVTSPRITVVKRPVLVVRTRR